MADIDNVERYRYQFSGYAPPLVQLDESGPAYWVADVHPYYYGQPYVWQGAAFSSYNGNIARTPEVMQQSLYPVLPLDQNLVLKH